MDEPRIEMELQHYLRLLPGIALAGFIFLLFCQIGPGDDFFGAYRLLVFDPEKYSHTFGIYSPAWLATIMAPFETMPGRKGYFIFIALTIAGIFKTARVFNGKLIPVLLSAQMFWVLWWGQIDGLAILGITLGYLSLERKSLGLLVCGLLLATLKPQIGLIPILAIWWWSDPKIRWRSLLIVLICGLLSVYIWGLWPLWVGQHILGLLGHNAYASWNISIGPAAIPLLIPAIFIPLERKQRITALIATMLLVSPYMPFYSSLVLLCMSIPWWAYIFAFTGFLPNLIGTQWAWKIILLLPLLVLIYLYLPYIREKFIIVKNKWKLART